MTSPIGQRIVHARSLAGLSGHQLARTIGLSSPSAISQYETGKRTPQPGRLRAIAEATDVSLEWLTYGTGEPRATASAPAPDQQALIRIESKLDSLLEARNDILALLEAIKPGGAVAADLTPTQRAVVDAVARGSRVAQRTPAPQSRRASQRSAD